MIRKYIYLIISPVLTLTGCFEEQEFDVASELNYLAFSESEAILLEGEVDEYTFDIIYSGNQNEAIEFSLGVDPDGTNATQGEDYTISPALGNLTIPAGESSLTIKVDIVNNDLQVGSRTLGFELNTTENIDLGYLGSDEGKSLNITILEDDAIFFGSTSFEEPTAGLINNFASQDGVEQENVPGENTVDYVSVGGEMGFNTSYLPGQEGGADEGLLFGVTDVTSDPDWEYDVGSFPDGMQAYSTSDADGLMEIVFDELEIAETTELLQVSAFLWFADASWEEDDEIDFFWRTEDGDELILSLRSNGDSMTNSADGTGDVIVEQWVNFMPEVSNIKSGSLVIHIGTDSGSEIAFLDNIVISGF